jgi:hypothetical protein
LHNASGFPQRFLFSANAFARNLSKLLGIEPLKLLLETFKSNKPAAMLGSGPEKVLFSKNRLVKLVRLLIESGIGPENLLVERSRQTKRVNWVKLGGNPPESALFWR